MGTETRTTRGINLYRAGAVEHVRGHSFTVESCGGRTYRVDLSGDVATCTCPDRPPEGAVCKHAAASYIYAAKHLPAKTPTAKAAPAFSPEEIAANLARMAG